MVVVMQHRAEWCQMDPNGGGACVVRVSCVCVVCVVWYIKKQFVCVGRGV